MPTAIPNTIEINNQTYPLIATRRKGTRRFVLRFNAKKQAVAISMPMRSNLKDALKFAHAHTAWLEKQIEKSGGTIELKPGMVISVLGENILLKHEPGRGLATKIPSPVGVRRDIYVAGRGHSCSELKECAVDAPLPTSPLQGEEIHATLTIHGDISFFKRRLKDWITKHLKAELTRLSREKAELLGVKFARIQIRDTTHHWGSCSPTGTLSYSLRLAFADPPHVDYIVCHEVAHLKELNHSARFWKLVDELCPDYPRLRRWFKTHGHELGRFRFG